MKYAPYSRPRLRFALVLASFAAPSLAGDCGDTFAGPSLGAAFSTLDKTASKDAKIEVGGGKLTLTATGRDIYNTTNEYVVARRKDVQGDFEMSVSIESQDSVHEWSQAGLVVANDFEKLDQGGYVAVDVSPKNGRTFFLDRTSTVGTLDSNVSKGASRYPVWLKLAKKSGKFSAWYKEQASDAWTVIVTDKVAQQTAVNSQIGIFSLSHNASKAGKAVFAQFTCADASTVALRPDPKAHGAPLRMARWAGALVPAVNALGITLDSRPISSGTRRLLDPRSPGKASTASRD